MRVLRPVQSVVIAAALRARRQRVAILPAALSLRSGGRVSRQSVIITGGTQGLGFGYAREFGRLGHNVLLCGRTQAAVDAAVSRLAPLFAAGARVVGQVADTADLAALEALWARGVAEFGRVDIWLNNAGFARTGAKFIDNTPADIEAMVRANVIGSINAAQVAVAGMQRQGGGKLYLTLGGGGASGRVVPGMTVYSTTKRAVKYLANALVKERREARDDSILIGTISPGVNITEGMVRELNALPTGERAKALRQLNFIGEEVETTTPWIVARVLADTRQGNDITWLTTGRMLGRAVSMIFSKRDVLSRHGLKA
jgi:NAD(P)-dependent dehydrogenase (short-subunit alcohol dehydrogenase family)